jgi:hypothetical protein
MEAHVVDIVVRGNGRTIRLQGDWLKDPYQVAVFAAETAREETERLRAELIRR